MSLTAYQKQVVGLGPDVGLYCPLDSLYKGGDISSPAHATEALGGLTLGGLSPGPLSRDGRTATTFDGSNDQLATTWQTKTNLVPTPSPEPEGSVGAWSTTSGFWTNAGATAFRSALGAEGLLSIPGLTMCVEVTTPGLAAAEGAKQDNMAVVKGTTYRVSTYMKGAGAGGQKVRFGFGNGTVGSAFTDVTLTAKWQRYSFTFTATETGTGTFSTAVPIGSTLAQQWWVTGAMMEEGSTLNAYFPEVQQVTLEEAGFTGTAWQSASQLGPLANGTLRTFSAWLNPSGAAIRGLWGRSATDGLWLTAGGALRWRANGVDETWTATVANGSWTFLAHVFDTRNDLSTIYINGAAVETKVNANPYSTTASAPFVIGQSLGSFYSGGMAQFALMYGDQSATVRSLWRAGSGL